MKIIYCGDVVGRSGREAVLNNLEKLRETYKPDVIVVNVENAAHGFGVTPGICRDFLNNGVNMLVTGNHVWQQRELIPFLNESKQIVRPLNYPEALPGRGAAEIELPSGKKLLVVQLLGRLFMEAVDCPAQAIEKLLKTTRWAGTSLPFWSTCMPKQLPKNWRWAIFWTAGFPPLPERIRMCRPPMPEFCPKAPPILPMSACAAIMNRYLVLRLRNRSTG